MPLASSSSMAVRSAASFAWNCCFSRPKVGKPARSTSLAFFVAPAFDLLGDKVVELVAQIHVPGGHGIGPFERRNFEHVLACLAKIAHTKDRRGPFDQGERKRLGCPSFPRVGMMLVIRPKCWVSLQARGLQRKVRRRGWLGTFPN